METANPSICRLVTDSRRRTGTSQDFTFRSLFYRAGWVAENVHFENPSISLEINRKPVDHQPYSGAEVQKRGYYGFGRYEVVMQAAPGSGAVSSFFTHTDATFGDPHDEIDIEFLGNNTRQIHANVFADGQTTGSIYIDLPFDAAEEVHLYAFDWQPRLSDLVCRWRGEKKQ